MLCHLSNPSRKCFVPLKLKALYVQTLFLFAPLTAFQKGTVNKCHEASPSISIYGASSLCPEQHRHIFSGLWAGGGGVLSGPGKTCQARDVELSFSDT